MVRALREFDGYENVIDVRRPRVTDTSLVALSTAVRRRTIGSFTTADENTSITTTRAVGGRVPESYGIYFKNYRRYPGRSERILYPRISTVGRIRMDRECRYSSSARSEDPPCCIHTLCHSARTLYKNASREYIKRFRHRV